VRRSWDLEYFIRIAAAARESGQFGLPVLLHQGPVSIWSIVNAQKAGTLPLIPPASGAWLRICSQYAAAAIAAAEDWRRQTPEQKVAINQFHICGDRRALPRRHGQDQTEAADLPARSAGWPTTSLKAPRTGLIPDLDVKRQEGAAPLDIINGPLMAGMSEVGRLFNNNELIVAEVLQSAEAMKAAVNHLRAVHGKRPTRPRAARLSSRR